MGLSTDADWQGTTFSAGILKLFICCVHRNTWYVLYMLCTQEYLICSLSSSHSILRINVGSQYVHFLPWCQETSRHPFITLSCCKSPDKLVQTLLSIWRSGAIHHVCSSYGLYHPFTLRRQLQSRHCSSFSRHNMTRQWKTMWSHTKSLVFSFLWALK